MIHSSSFRAGGTKYLNFTTILLVNTLQITVLQVVLLVDKYYTWKRLSPSPRAVPDERTIKALFRELELLPQKLITPILV